MSEEAPPKGRPRGGNIGIPCVPKSKRITRRPDGRTSFCHRPQRKIRRNLMVQLRNWDWAKKQPGGASGYIDNFLNYFRVQDERARLRKELEKARAEILRLNALLRKHSIEAYEPGPAAPSAETATN